MTVKVEKLQSFSILYMYKIVQHFEHKIQLNLTKKLHNNYDTRELH